jgi:hypothetical protein
MHGSPQVLCILTTSLWGLTPIVKFTKDASGWLIKILRSPMQLYICGFLYVIAQGATRTVVYHGSQIFKIKKLEIIKISQSRLWLENLNFEFSNIIFRKVYVTNFPKQYLPWLGTKWRLSSEAESYYFLKFSPAGEAEIFTCRLKFSPAGWNFHLRSSICIVWRDVWAQWSSKSAPGSPHDPPVVCNYKITTQGAIRAGRVDELEYLPHARDQKKNVRKQ